MHETTKRLYQAAGLKGIESPSALARLLGESPQTLKNWETRGVSAAGIINAQTLLGCDANWLKTGVVTVRQESTQLATTTTITPREQILIELFGDLTQSQQDALIQSLEKQKQDNDTLFNELAQRRKA